MKSYFQFTRKQRIGVASLSTLILVFIVLLNVNHHLTLPDPADVDVSEIVFTSYPKDSSYYNRTSSYPSEKYNPKSTKKHKLFKFDPNELDTQGWCSLGFSEKQAAIIVNYRNNYGLFEKPEDIKKIYVVSDEKYLEIKPYMIFSDDVNKKDEVRNLIEINAASAEDLESINGIGPAFSNRTIKYREALGGFISKDQFSSIYKITDEALAALSENVTIDVSKIMTIRINYASKDEIRKHPYLGDWAIVTAIISQRDKAQLENLDFLIDQELMTQDEMNLVVPYIDFE